MRKGLLAVAALLLAALTGCGPLSGTDPNDKVVATVNGDKITVSEIRADLALRARQDPSFRVTPAVLNEQLDVMINRRLLIQEAVRRRMSRDERFVRSIRGFWEQSLIKMLVEKLSAEFREAATASETEINDYYARLSTKVSFDILKRQKKEEVEELARKAKAGEAIAWDQRIGPVGFEEVSSMGLKRAFSLNVGEMQGFAEGGSLYLVRVAAKEAVTPPPLSEINEKVRQRVRALKEEAAFERWLRARRAAAKVEMMK